MADIRNNSPINPLKSILEEIDSEFKLRIEDEELWRMLDDARYRLDRLLVYEAAAKKTKELKKRLARSL